LRIVVADDYQLIRRGLQLIISRRPGWSIVAEPEDSTQLFESLRRERVDVVTLELRLHNASGFEILEQIRRDHPAIPVLVLSSYPEEQYAISALRAGARGYIEKTASSDEIIDALERVVSGRRRFSERITDMMAEELSVETRAPHERLSPRELEVFRRIALGDSVTRIAAGLGISVKTVSTFRTRVLEKTGFRTNADIVAYAIRTGLIA
jgi:two-component system invasion response regulator UvrY